MARPKAKHSQPQRRLRVRTRPLEQLDEAKLATAVIVMAKRLAEQQSADDRGAALEPRPDAEEGAA